MDKLHHFIEMRSTGELTLLMIGAAIAIFVAGLKVGEALAYLTGAA